MGGSSLGFLPLIRTPSDWVLPQHLASWAFQCYFVLCRQCQFLCPSFLFSSVLFVRLTCGRRRPRCFSSWGVLPCPIRGLDGLVGRLMCCVRLPARFSSLWSCSLPPPCPGSSMCLARQAKVSSSLIAFLVFVSAYLSDLTSWLLFVVSRDDLFNCGACGFSLSGAGRYLLLQAPRSSFSLRSPQYLVAVASRCSSTSSSFLGRLGSPPRSLASTLSVSPSILRFSLSCLCAGAVSLSHSLFDLAVSSSIPWRDSRSSPSPGSSFSCQFLAFPIPGPFSWCSSMRWVPSSCCFSCYPLLPGCAYCAWGVSPPLFIVVSCLLISLWALAILFMAPLPFCLRSFFAVLTFRPVVPPGWSSLGFLLCAPGSHSLCLFVHCVCTALGPSSFLLPSSLAASSLGVLCPLLPFYSS